MEHFHVYLYGTHFTVVTDHSALQWLFKISKPTGQLYRWSVRLSVYDYQVVHRSGTKQQHVDALSRAPINPFVSTKDNRFTTELQTETTERIHSKRNQNTTQRNNQNRRNRITHTKSS